MFFLQRGSRGEALTAAIKVEFNGVTLGESSRVETSEGQDVNFNFSTTYACNFVDGLDELSNKPLIGSNNTQAIPIPPHTHWIVFILLAFEHLKSRVMST